MPELRKDPVTRRWVIIATGRGKRPTDFVKKDISDYDFSGCPFCPGNEKMTPPETLAYRKVGAVEDGPGWWTRVFEDKNPLFTREENIKRCGVSIYDKMDSYGVHEIVVETDVHEENIYDMEVWKVEQQLWAYKDRINSIKTDDKIQHVLMVKNYGRDAGSASKLVHPHSHIFGLPVIPKRVVDKFRGARSFFKFRERCIWCDMILQELEQKERIVMENKYFVAFTPFASRFPFEVMVVPKQHSCHYEDLSNNELIHLAHILKITMSKIVKALGDPAYNYIFFTSPYERRYEESFHWHVEIMPRITGIAGFEWGSGFYINTTSPEEAASILRETKID